MAVRTRFSFETAMLLCFLFSVVIITTSGLRDDLLNNDGQVDTSHQKRTFRLKKYKDIWFKAQAKGFSEEKLQRLQKILYKLDKMELEHKHADKEEESEKEIQKKSDVHKLLNDVLKEYHLLDDGDGGVVDFDHVYFQDHRINRLWQDAVDEGRYSKDELRSLYVEMRHMETKIEEVRSFAKKTSDFRKSVGLGMDDDAAHVSQNMVDTLDAETVKKADEMHNKLKKKKAKIEKKVKHIEDMVKNKKKTDFDDDRVRRLWDSAKNATFTATELERIKEELNHFQKHIDKLDHWEEMHSKLQSKGADDEIAHVQKKVGEYKKKVKKYHKTMLKKVKEKTEL